jgi:flavin reductase (DIM6/NTAB) family NADH-FMN oxidoreductase RutF
MEAQPPPYPDYRQQKAVPTRDYRVVFWQHQLPPEGSNIRPDEMGWSELTIDLVGVEDVHEAIAWAECHIDDELDKDDPGPHGERSYVLYVKVPDEDWFVQIAGWDPTRAPDAAGVDNLSRRHPLSPSQ